MTIKANIQGKEQADHPDEGELVSRIINGQTALFEILVRRLNPVLYKIGMSYGFGHHDTEDLMQETFISAYRNLDKFEQRSAFKTWITRIMLNHCSKKLQRMSFKNERAMETSMDEKNIPAFSDPGITDAGRNVVNRELNQVIGQALREIPLDYRMVFSLREINGFNTAETSELLNITETNVKARLKRSRQMLRDKIEKMYSASDIFEFNLIYCDSMVEKVMQEIRKPQAT